MNSITNKELAFLLGRLSLGINFIAHGLIRFPKINAFSQGMVEKFQETYIGFDSLIYGYSFILVFVEFFIGLTLIIGFKTKASLVTASFVMMSLIFGASMQENWNLVGSQMIYVIFIYLLILGFTETKYSLDAKFK